MRRSRLVLAALLPAIASRAGAPQTTAPSPPEAPPQAAAAAPADAPGLGGYAAVTADRTISFPRDYGSHPAFRTEWWYVTGWLSTERGETLGFQATFFRSNPGIDSANPSAFTPRQLLIAHCAISDPKLGRLWQDQRVRRAGLGLAEAATGDTNVWLDRWTLKREAARYKIGIDADDFSLDLTLGDTQPVMLQGTAGLSRKGTAAAAASYYYSLPHMTVAGAVTRDGSRDRVSGEAWLDHEWSSNYLEDQAVGWDWTGINLADGSALMAFRIRGADGRIRWAGGSLRGGDGSVQLLRPDDVLFHAERQWLSPRTGIRYPVQWRVTAGSRTFELRPLLDDQENDTRATTGAIYWEGAVSAYEQDRPVGRGYLELTGYGERLRLR